MKGPFYSFVIAAMLFCSACGANENILKSGKDEIPPVNVESTKTTFEQELEAMRTADFRFVYVLRRKDGGQIDTEDRSVIKVQTADANRRISADDGRAFIIGTNNQLAAKNLAALFNRFAVENYSPPATAANGNANAAK